MILNVYLRFNKLWTYTWFLFCRWLLASTNLSFGQCACHQRELGTAPSFLLFSSHSFCVTSSQLINIAHTRHSAQCFFSLFLSSHFITIYSQRKKRKEKQIITAAKMFHFTSEIKWRQFGLILFFFNKSNDVRFVFNFCTQSQKW